MKLDEAIKFYEQRIKDGEEALKQEHVNVFLEKPGMLRSQEHVRRLVEWLKELKERREREDDLK